jgi:hypothetical protein
LKGKNMKSIRQLRLGTKTPEASIVTEDVTIVNSAGAALGIGDLPITVITTATAIGTAAKTVTDNEPKANTLVAIKFTNGNSAASPTVAFNGGAAKNILLGGTAPAAIEATLAANGVALFFWDGTSLNQIGVYS